MLPLLLVTIIAGTIPPYNVDGSCRADTEAAGDPSAYQSCVKDEEAAKQAVARKWSSYSTAARQICTSEQDGVSQHSYVELMTCFEMQAWKTH